MQKLTYNTKHKTQMIDITKDVKEAVIKSGLKDGAVLIFVPHSTCSIFVSEHVDPNLTRDLLSKLHDLVPAGTNYHHVGDNAEAHIKAAIMGSNTTLPVQNATVVMGEWQGIFLTDFDGPRERDVFIKVLG
jgi:secondary thiamine-phosphate synthase enzyme